MYSVDLTYTFLLDETPEEVFKAINNVRGWWSETIEGNTNDVNDEFIYRHKDMHSSTQKLTEVIENKKVVWLVTDSKLTFVEKQNEWDDTQIIFEISRENDQTKLHFTHLGLVPEHQCFNDCNKGWGYYLENSLLPLIQTGKGNPDKP